MNGRHQEFQDRVEMPWWIKFLIPFGMLCFLVFLFIYLSKFHGELSENQDDWGNFGDYLGGVLGSVFGLLTLIVVILAFRLQHRELANSVRELKNSTDALREQGVTLKKQNFETTLFQMLSLHNDIINSLEMHVGMDNLLLRGRDCLKELGEQLGRSFRSQGLYDEKKDYPSDLSEIEDVYGEFYKNYQHSIGHYYRLLYNIFKFIKTSEIDDKRFYTNLVRAQLSTQELILIFYNCLSPWGREKFKPLIEEFSLLKTLPEKNFYGEKFKYLYDRSAFSDSKPAS